MKTRILLSALLLQPSCSLLFIPRCGDGFSQLSEDCDDGNKVSGDGCSARCDLELCGDSLINNNEVCDDGNTTGGDGCSADCLKVEVCGDSFIDAGEQCDDGNVVGGDGCASDCSKSELCGDGVVDAGEQCDDGNTTNTDACQNNCTSIGCHDGVNTPGSLCINATQVLATLSNPADIALADFNADGLLDVVVVDASASAASVFLKDARGFFGSQQIIPIGAQPSSVLVADINRDGALDFTTTNSTSSTISIVEGNGDGTFGIAKSVVTSAAPSDHVLADLNGDTLLDIAVASPDTNELSIHLQESNGVFTRSVQPVQGAPRSVVAADLDQDGALDLGVVGSAADEIKILHNDGAASFSVTSISLSTASPSELAVTDLDDDTLPDLIVSNQGSSDLSVLFNDSGLSFSAQTLSVGAPPTSLSVSDIGGSSLPDLLVTTESTLSLFINQGNQGFSSRQDLSIAAGLKDAALADLDKDGSVDIALSFFDENQILLLPGSATGFFLPTPLLSTNHQGGFMTAADFNDDNLADLAIVNSDAAVDIFLQSNGSLTQGASLQNGQNSFGIASGQLNSDVDAFTDLAIANFGDNNISIFFGDGNGTFSAPVALSSGGGADGVVIVDLGGDNKSDIAVNNFVDNSISLFSGFGDGTFAAPLTVSGVGGEPILIAAGDVGGDATIELVVSNFTPGTITIRQAVGAPVTLNACTEPQEIKIADMNLDGLGEVVVACDGELVILGDVFAATPSRTSFVLGAGPSALDVSDLNGDGLPDLVASSTGISGAPGNVRVFLQEATGDFTGPIVYQTALLSSDVIVADFNGDTLPDFITSQRGSRGVNLFFSAP